MIVVFVVIAAAVMVGLIILEHKKAQARTEALRALAHELGWTFDPAKDSSHDDEFAHFGVFRQGHSRAAFNTLRGSMEAGGGTCRATMGDFRYRVTRSNGKHTTTRTYTFSYAIVECPWPGAPTLLIRHENFLDKIAAAIGFDDIDFESAEFSGRYKVTCSDRRFAYDLITPAMMEFLLEHDPAVLDLEHGQICLTDGRRVWTIPEFHAMLHFARQFYSLWPEHLVRTMEAR